MAYQIKTLLIEPDQRSEIVFALAHHRPGCLRMVVADDSQKNFFQDVLLNINFANISVSTFDSFLGESSSEQTVVFLDIPSTFETLEMLISKAAANKQDSFLVLLKINKKYLNMIEKRLPIKTELVSFSSNKFLGINDKLRELVEKNYDLNRAGFYAYGSFINNFRDNLLKRIFQTDQIDVTQLARSFGFTTAPRVKEGSFLTHNARMQKKQGALSEKRKNKREKLRVSKVPTPEEPTAEVKVGNPKKSKKISKLSS